MTGAFIPPIAEGPRLRLRPVRPDDSSYIHALRGNPTYNLHLSAVTGSVDDQRAWIEGYMQREAEGAEIYYIIERRDNGLPCGTVRLYEIETDRFTWGSWILDESKTPMAALESAVLSFGVGFRDLGRDLAHVDVRVGNTHADAFYRRLGMRETHRTTHDIFYVYSRSRFEADISGYMDLLEQRVGT
jgi:RimJ/RimL family protein N-acetyltransferase